MTDGIAEVTARITRLQTMLGVGATGLLGGNTSTSRPAAADSSASTSFADTLSEALSSLNAQGSGSALGNNGVPGNGIDSPGSPTVGRQAVALAKSYTGVPYLWGGTNPSKGLDCSGLVQLVYRQLGIALPRIASDQAKAGVAVPSLDEAQPGDLLFFGSPAHHVGIYVGDGRMVDAPHSGKTVGIHAVAGYGKVSSIRRVSDAHETTGAAGASALSGPYANLFVQAGKRYGVDPALLSAVARTESSYSPSAVSSAGARGLMQLMPGTARSLSVNPDDPAQAIDGAARLLSDLLKQFDGRTDLALAGYNAGPGAVHRYGGVPPYAQTRTYVQRVTRAWEALR
jgi:cell wall-associated NlpC family hydrolase